jgi:6-phosphogluconolactonase
MIKIFLDIEELNNYAAEKFIEIGGNVIDRKGLFTVALSGGSTPKSLYRLLASGKFNNKINWDKGFFFFGDERNVLPEDEESNFKMANESLFAPLKISETNIFRWKTEIKDTAKIAEDYETRILSRFASGGEKSFPRFDLILLGMGADGHTASLFPETGALRETEKIAVANWVEKLNDFRLTLTFRAINNARNVIFLVAGEEKAETLREVLRGDYQPEKLPAQAVKPENGNLIWFIDEKAARFLT